MGPADRESPSRPELPDNAALLDQLFELSSESWIVRLRSAVAPVSLGALGPYELIAEIGRGGQGEVYKALQPGTRRPIALKRIAGLGLAPGAPERQRFAREVEALTRLSHPNVVTVHTAELIDRHALLVMELVEGRPIDQWADARWDSGTRALEDILQVFAGACDGVAHAHQRGVIHRDLKPGNVIVTAQGIAKVVDFGIAKVLGEQAGEATVSDAFMGTLAYAAPERIGHFKHEPDTRTDVYSLGVLFFRILAGREARTRYQLGSGTAPISAPSQFRALPRECDWIVGTATAIEPERRYQTVDALANDVRALLAGAAVAAAPPSPTYRLRKAIRRNRTVAGVALLIALILLGATLVSIVAARRAREALAAAKKSEEQSQLEANRQIQVSQLMREVLGASGAVSGGRPDITVRDALDRAVEARFPAGTAAPSGMDPLVEASVRDAIGDTYLGIGLYADATTHLRAADALLAASVRAGDAQHLRIQYTLGRSLRAAGRLEEAEQVLRRVVEAYRAQDESAALPLAEALTSLGIALRWSGNSEGAEACYREAMSLYERAEGPGSTGVSTSSLNIAVLLSRRGNHTEAIPLATRGVEILDRTHANAHPEKSGAYALLGNILWASGDTAQGEEYLRKAIAMDREMNPEPSLGMAGRISELADRLSRIERHEEALVLHRESLEMSTQLSGPTGPSTLTFARRYSVALRRAGRPQEARQLCLGVVSLRPDIGSEASALEAELAEVQLELGEEANAEASFLRAWDLQPTDSDANRAARNTLANRIAEFYETKGDFEATALWSNRTAND